ncbi:MAG TPA: S8 family serine peptidase [bacterium]
MKKMIMFAAAMLAMGFAASNADVYQMPGSGTIHQFAPARFGNADLICFSNGITIDVKTGEPALEYTIEKSEYYIVHFNSPIYQQSKDQLEAAGAQIYSYLPNYAFIVRMDDIAQAKVAACDFIDWVGIYQPSYKLSSQDEFKSLSGTHVVTILLYADAGAENVMNYLRSNKAVIKDVAESKWDKLINAEINLALVPELAKFDEVSWIEPWHKMELDNNSVQWVLQTCINGNRHVWDMGIRGNGELMSTCDTGVRTSHYAFRSTSSSWITTWGNYPNDRKIIGYQPANTMGAGYADFGDEAVNYYHGSHTAGTCSGDDTLNAADTRDGLAIKGRLYFLDGGGSNGAVYLYPNLNTLWAIPYNGNAAGSVKLCSNSWGSNANGSYTSNSAQCDQFMWDHKDFLLFFSNGNNGPGSGTVGSPATAKNVVSVGSCNNSTGYATLSSFSSRGPCDDGRRKPTILTPGNTVYSVNGGGDAGYTGMQGTSMSSPGAMGAGVLVRQYFTDGFYPTGAANSSDSIAPSAALMKAVLVNGADNSMSGYTVPDNNIGWGRVDLDSVLYFTGDAKKLAIVDEATGLSTGQFVEYDYNVLSGSVPLRVALVWTDYPGAAGGAHNIINDLHLTVTDPNNVVYLGNVYSGGQSATGGSADTVNVEECVRRNSPTAGNWTIRVDASHVPNGPQPFAIVVTGDLGTASQPSIVYETNTIDDAGGNNNGKVDPGETVNMTVTLRNDGSTNATNTNGTLRTASAYITLLDSTATYGTITGGGGTANGIFQFTASASTPQGTTVAFTVYVTADGGYTTNCNFQIVVGAPRYDYVDHNVGNCVLTVTKQGSIGFLDVNSGGSGFIYPKSGTNELYHSSLALANANNWVLDRFYPNTGANPNNTDWRCTTVPNGQCWIDSIAPAVSDQESWSMYADSGNSAPKGIVVTQHGYAWRAAGYDDFVIVLCDVKNNSGAAINNIYTGVIADFDMGNAYVNRGATDTLRRLSYEWEPGAPNRYVGVKLLDPYTAANVTSLDNTNYVYNGATNIWNDTTLWKFLNGTLEFLASPVDTDLSVVVSAGPYNLGGGEVKHVAFAFVGGTTLPTLIEDADSAQAIYDSLFYGISEDNAIISPFDRDFIQSYPNPFCEKTRLVFNLRVSGNVKVNVYDIAGKLVRTVLDEPRKTGEQVMYWDGRDNDGTALPNGIYFFSIETPLVKKTGKLILMK